MSFYPTADDWLEPDDDDAKRRDVSEGKPRRPRPSSPAAVIAPFILAGAFTLVALAGRSKLGAWLRGFLSPRRDLPAQDELPRDVATGRLPLPLLRESILGRRKVAVADRLGPPRTAVITGNPAAGPAPVGQSAYWRADVWYYAVDPESQTAMAVTFDRHGFASEVDFFEAPQPPPNLA
jgi:hypothetical protein